MKTMIVIHCSAGNQRQRALEIKEWHLRPVSRGGRGWKMPGYHYVVEADGTVVALCDENAVANGAKGYNHESIHVCYTGGIDSAGRPCDTRTAAQRASLQRIVREICSRHPIRRIAGHRDLSPDVNGNGHVDPYEWIKACPSFDVSAEFSLS